MILDSALVAAITAFLKTFFPNISGGTTFAVVLVVGAVFALIAPLEAQFPGIAVWLDPVVAWLKVAFGAAGGVSLVNYFIVKAKK